MTQLKLIPTPFGAYAGRKRRLGYTGPDGTKRNLGTGWKTVRDAREYLERAYRGHPHLPVALQTLREEFLET